MIRDPGPGYNLGFGVPPQRRDEEEGSPAGASFIQRALSGHPVASFLATSAASIVAMHVAGKVVKTGGLRLGYRLQETAKGGNEFAQTAVTSIRKIREYMDTLEGVNRKLIDKDDLNKIVKRESVTNVKGKSRYVYSGETTETVDNFFIRSGRIKDGDVVEEWTVKDAIQQRLVSQARRLPYELPGMYLADKALIQPIFNNDPNKKKVNWFNPIDVLGDFAHTSLKNLATAVIPFEVGMGAGSAQYNKVMSQGLKFFSGGNSESNLGMVTARAVLSNVGADAEDLLNKVIRFGNQSTGAMASFIEGSLHDGLTFNQWMRKMNSQATQAEPLANGSFARRSWETGRQILHPKNFKDHANALPGPFKGIASAWEFGSARFTKIGEVYDDWQDILSGKKKLAEFSADRQLDIRAFMGKSRTQVEDYSAQIVQMGHGGRRLADGRVNPQFRQGTFFQGRSQAAYKSLLSSSLQETGIDPEIAERFVRSASVVKPLRRGGSYGPGQALAERIRFATGVPVDSAKNGISVENWFNSIMSEAEKAKANLGKIEFDQFHSAVTRADAIFSTRYFQNSLETQIENQWNLVHNKILPKFAGDILSTKRRPFDEFEGALKSTQRDFLVRRTAQRLGIETVDAAGNNIPDELLKNSIRSRGLDPTKMNTLRGYLTSKGDISKPWSRHGANLFGFQQVSVNDAFQRGFFDGNDDAVKSEISHIINARNYGLNIPDTAKNLRLKGVYRTSSGRVIDVNRITKAFSRSTDTFSEQYQIPLLHFNPANLLGYGARKDLRNKAVIQMVEGESLQPFVHGAANDVKPDFYMWMKTSARGSRGKIVSITGGFGKSPATSLEHEGIYRPFSNAATSIAGKHIRLGAKQFGTPTSGEADSKWRKRFDISNDQSESIYGLGKRWLEFLKAGRSESAGNGIKNPIRGAQWFAKRASNAMFSPEETAAFYNLQKQLSNYGFSRRLVSKLGLDSFQINGKAIHEIDDAHLPEIVRQLFGDDFAVVAGGTKDELRRVQGNLRNIIQRGLKKSNYYEQGTTQTMRSVGVSRRIDQLRNELYKYSAIKQQIKAGGNGEQFNTWVQDLLNKVEGLQMSGQIAKKEVAEARAAVLGIQLEYYSNRAYKSIVDEAVNPILGAVPADVATRTMRFLTHGETGTLNRGLLNEFAKKNPHSTGKLGFLKNAGRRIFGAAPYEEGTAWNPFGSNTTFVPTFGTAFARNPKAALASVAGLNTWSNPEAFSGSSVISSHMVYRLNRYFETFHMGIDPSRYKGPLDYYARGMVGKRVLPIVAGATTLTMADRQLGGLVHKDEQGNPIYAPLFMGYAADAIAGGQVALAGLIPGGQTAEEKKYELTQGEVPIRAGRFWPLGNTPFKGGRIQYFRPSWYQRLKSGGTFIPEKNETPLERLAFGYDYSPLRPFDPYRFERQNYESRPYPVTGDYFTGPWGPLTGILNQTVGRVLKPRRMMHEEEMKYGLQQYLPVGESGAYMSQKPITSAPAGALAAQRLSAINAMTSGTPMGGGTSFYSGMGATAGRGGASAMVRQRTTDMASMYSAAAAQPGGYPDVYRTLAPYGVPSAPGTMTPRVIAATQPLNPGSISAQAGKIGYQTQEMMGIYGFASGSLRSKLGMGNQDFTPDQSVLEPASRGYSATRSFWGMNLGGMGDLPLPIEGNFANLEISEIIRRFVPKEQSGINYINPIANKLGKEYPWLPGSNYPINPLKMGDPYGSLPDAELRLPGTGYNRTHELFPDQYGQMGIANIHDILGDVAPWSPEFKAVDRLVNSSSLTPKAYEKVLQTRAQVDSMRMKNEFTPYDYKYSSPEQLMQHPKRFAMGRAWEWLAHRDTLFNTKFLPVRTAVEDWERENVYGATFPTWQTPVDSFLKPMAYKASQRNPISAALGLGVVGSLFGVTPQAKAMAAAGGGITGFAISTLANAREAITGERFIPKARKKELALEEYTDILNYTKSVMLASKASQSGDQAAVNYWVNQSKRTMYGVDLNSTPEKIAMALPKRKREHFLSMLYAPEQERKQILSTAGRLERRIYEAAWGMPVEQRPDIPEYFEDHELPGPGSDIWSPLLNMDTIKIKVGQSQGMDMAQMGYYPQQIKEANLINPSYPEMYKRSSNESVQAQLRRLLFNQQLNGSVQAIPTPYPGTRVQLSAGVY